MKNPELGTVIEINGVDFKVEKRTESNCKNCDLKFAEGEFDCLAIPCALESGEKIQYKKIERVIW